MVTLSAFSTRQLPLGLLNQFIEQTLSTKNTPLFPKVAFRYDTLHSTNTTAVNAVQGPTPPAHGDVVWTDAQSAGRGQGSNRWHSSPGDNLTLSVIAYPETLEAPQLFDLTKVTGLAVRQTVAHYIGESPAAPVTVKWPNDVYVGDKKIAGILVQNGLRGNRVAWSVMGIGLNVNEHNFPSSLVDTATSIRLQTGKDHYLETVANYLFEQLSYQYEQLRPENRTRLTDTYHHYLYRKGVVSHFQLTATGQLFKGIIRGVNQHGQLRVEQPVGRESAFSVGEIKLLR